ncbi:unnamed protein product [Rotaria sp. Silwood2]|nr:unnamed protein product [Rotaria sp. Silwood2]CAF4194097.1 unnamed protein product [Rotaria sp. Silwood2]
MSFALIIINSHIFWGFEIVNEQSQKNCLPSKTKIVYHNKPNSLTYDRFYAIFDSLDMLFAVLIPFIVIRSITTVLSTTVQSKKTRKRYEKERQLTVMLLGSAAAFLVFTLPTEINDTVRAFHPPNLSQPKGAMALMTAVFIAMEQLNHAIHFYIYTLTGRVFRNELIQLFTFSKYTSLTQQKSISLRRMNNDHQVNSLIKHKTNHRDS